MSEKNNNKKNLLPGVWYLGSTCLMSCRCIDKSTHRWTDLWMSFYLFSTISLKFWCNPKLIQLGEVWWFWSSLLTRLYARMFLNVLCYSSFISLPYCVMVAKLITEFSWPAEFDLKVLLFYNHVYNSIWFWIFCCNTTSLCLKLFLWHKNGPFFCSFVHKTIEKQSGRWWQLLRELPGRDELVGFILNAI